jgi:hypothetical protein
MKKFSKKHIAIFKSISEKGMYRPAYSDKEPATQTLIKNGLIDWRHDFRGLIFTEKGKELSEKLSIEL